MVGRIYIEDHYTLLHTNYESFGPCGFREEGFFYVVFFFHCKSMEDNDPRGRAIFDPRGMVGRIYKEDHYTLLHKNMKALGLVVLEKKIFLCFSHDAPGAGPVWTPGARLARFIKRTTIHYYIRNTKALGLVVS